MDDLYALVDYISDDLGSSASAQRLFESILEKARLFADFPGAAAILRTQGGANTGYSYVVCENWMLFFGLEGQRALVVRVLYGKSDYMKALFGEMGKWAVPRSRGSWQDLGLERPRRAA